MNKREAFRKAFDNFDPKKIAKYNDKKIGILMTNSRLIRNRAKILSAITNARLVLNIQKEHGSFDKYVWSFARVKKVNQLASDLSELPTYTKESIAMSKELKRRGFKFVGPKICYSFMQAVGIVNDHLVKCFRYKNSQN